MKLIFAIYNVLIRFISGFIPSKNIRRKLREQCIYTQICPKGAKYYLVKDNKEIPFKFVKYGLKIEVFGKNNKIRG